MKEVNLRKFKFDTFSDETMRRYILSILNKKGDS